MKRTKFYVCPQCGNILQSTNECQISCCGALLSPLQPTKVDKSQIIITEIEDDFYIEFHHEMTKEHFIQFVAYANMDRVLTIRLYPEQEASVRFPRMRGGRLYSFCNQHGLFEYV